MLRHFINAVLMLALLAGPAAAQSFPMGPRSASPEEIERAKREENAYKRAIEKVPDKEKKASDPWGNVRSAPQSPSTANKRQQ